MKQYGLSLVDFIITNLPGEITGSFLGIAAFVIELAQQTYSSNLHEDIK